VSDVTARAWPVEDAGETWTAQVFTVYFYYDAGGRLLYVGETGQGHWRSREHDATAAWWSLVTRAEFEHYETEADAFAAEREAIIQRKPIYNITNNQVMRREAGARWPFMTVSERGQVALAVIDLRERHGVRTTQGALIRAALRVALRDLDTIADELRSETPPPA